MGAALSKVSNHKTGMVLAYYLMGNHLGIPGLWA